MKSFERSLFLPASVLLALAGLTVPAYSQLPIDASTLTPFVSGLNDPRGLAFGPDSKLYIAEAGTGGTTSTDGLCPQVVAPVGPYTGGPTARISRVDLLGNLTTVATGLPSAADAIGDLVGVADLSFISTDLYAILPGGGCSHGNPTLPDGIVKVNIFTGEWHYISDISAFLKTHPAAYEYAADFEPDGSPYGMIAFEGNLYWTEANHGQLIRTSPLGGSQVVSDISFDLGHIVPTGIAEANGNLYLTNLGQFPITPDWEKVMTFSRDFHFVDPTPGLGPNPGDLGTFQLAASRAGVTGALTLKFGPDGLLYVLEFSTAADYPTPGTGKVIRLKRDGTFQDVVINLSLPTGMTFGPDNALYISNFGDEGPGQGQILRANFLP